MARMGMVMSRRVSSGAAAWRGAMLGVECAALLPKRAALTPELPGSPPPDLAPPLFFCSWLRGRMFSPTALRGSNQSSRSRTTNRCHPSVHSFGSNFLILRDYSFLDHSSHFSINRRNDFPIRAVSFLLVGHINKVAIGAPNEAISMASFMPPATTIDLR